MYADMGNRQPGKAWYVLFLLSLLAGRSAISWIALALFSIGWLSFSICKPYIATLARAYACFYEMHHTL
jgi:hypothetical protein